MRILTYLFLVVLLVSCIEEKAPLEKYMLAEDKLTLRIVASEPMVIAPVAIDFDTKGRLWVAEMQDYMPDIDGKNEDIPSCRIMILEDFDGDGIMDQSKVFMDSIHHLRAIKLFNNGILYADDPNLYFTEILDDQPHQTVVIDSFYASGGNIEHKPNGLFYNLDNCIYNAKSNFRYCFSGNNWSKEPTSFRGQWGITSDENGRLYYNDNSNLLFGDYFLPNTVIKNQFLTKPEGISKDLVGDRSIYPAHATAVNRGYNKGTLDSNGYVIHTTSACGPHIFQSDALGIDLQGDAFVCIPEGNLIKRLSFDQNAFSPSAEMVYRQSEFLTATDEAFRPVNITTGPDGALYIVDFHRGIIQHKIYMTKFLKDLITKKKLDKVVNYGRILKIEQKGAEPVQHLYQFEHQDSLIKYLSYNNSWLRLKAQELLVLSDFESIDDKIYKLLQEGGKLEQLHGLWILAGRGKIDHEKLKTIDFDDPWVIANLFKIIAQPQSQFSSKEVLFWINKYKNQPNEIISNHLLTALSNIYLDFPNDHQHIISSDTISLESARISAFPTGVIPPGQSKLLSQYITNVENEHRNFIYNTPRRSNGEEGHDLYKNNCAACHGFGGEGIDGLAPPLEGGRLVNANVELVPLIIMHGLEGELTIDGELTKYTSIMPAFNLTDNEIEKISNFIYNAFRDQPKNIGLEEVTSLRQQFTNRTKMWTEEELLNTEIEVERLNK